MRGEARGQTKKWRSSPEQTKAAAELKEGGSKPWTNRFCRRPAAVRYENEVMIIPVLEEVLVAEKQLRLKEEVYVS